MVLGCTKRKISGSLLSIDGTPWIKRPFLMSKNFCPIPCLIQCVETVLQKFSCKLRCRVHKYRKYIHFCIPEIMSLIAFTGKSLCAHSCSSVSSGRLHNMKQIETDSLLKSLIIINLNIGNIPEFMDFLHMSLKLLLPSILCCLFQFFFCKSFQLTSLHVLTGCINNKFLTGNRSVFRNLHSAFTHSTSCLFLCAKNSYNLSGSFYFVLASTAHSHAALQSSALIIQHSVFRLKLVHMQSASKGSITDQRICLPCMVLHIPV